MTTFEETGPSRPVTDSVRVDKLSPKSRLSKAARIVLVLIAAVIMLIPIFVMIQTAFKTRTDVVAVPPKLVFEPSLEGFVFLLTERALLPPAALEDARANAEDLSLFQRVALESGQQITGPSDYVNRLKNSLIIAGISTLLSVVLGSLAAYAFSRYDVPGKDDLLFFILSTRMLPAVVVTIPLFLMYRQLGLHDTYTGMILL